MIKFTLVYLICHDGFITLEDLVFVFFDSIMRKLRSLLIFVFSSEQRILGTISALPRMKQEMHPWR